MGLTANHTFSRKASAVMFTFLICMMISSCHDAASSNQTFCSFENTDPTSVEEFAALAESQSVKFTPSELQSITDPVLFEETGVELFYDNDSKSSWLFYKKDVICLSSEPILDCISCNFTDEEVGSLLFVSTKGNGISYLFPHLFDLSTLEECEIDLSAAYTADGHYLLNGHGVRLEKCSDADIKIFGTKVVPNTNSEAKTLQTEEYLLGEIKLLNGVPTLMLSEA